MRLKSINNWEVISTKKMESAFILELAEKTNLKTFKFKICEELYFENIHILKENSFKFTIKPIYDIIDFHYSILQFEIIQIEKCGVSNSRAKSRFILTGQNLEIDKRDESLKSFNKSKMIVDGDVTRIHVHHDFLRTYLYSIFCDSNKKLTVILDTLPDKDFTKTGKKEKYFLELKHIEKNDDHSSEKNYVESIDEEIDLPF